MVAAFVFLIALSALLRRCAFGKQRTGQGVTNALCRTRNITIVPLALEAILTSQGGASGV